MVCGADGHPGTGRRSRDAEQAARTAIFFGTFFHAHLFGHWSRGIRTRIHVASRSNKRLRTPHRGRYGWGPRSIAARVSRRFGRLTMQLTFPSEAAEGIVPAEIL